MKKILIAISALLLIVLGAIYVLIPDELMTSHSVTINTNNKNVYNYLKEPEKIKKWWPGTMTVEDDTTSSVGSFYYENQSFVFKDLLYNSILTGIEKDGIKNESNIIVVPVKTDTTTAVWESKLVLSKNPLSRVRQYYQVKNAKSSMSVILNSLKKFLDNNEHIYGFPIIMENIKDTLYIAHTLVQANYPSDLLITTSLAKLRSYVQAAGEVETGFPIMTVSRIGDNKLNIVFGIPIKTRITETKDFALKTMPGTGHAVTTTATGGQYNVLKGLEAISQYEADFMLSQPIVPFISFVTDRSKETDSTKWVTKIWGPVY
jgi:hypothetical protein